MRYRWFVPFMSLLALLGRSELGQAKQHAAKTRAEPRYGKTLKLRIQQHAGQTAPASSSAYPRVLQQQTVGPRSPDLMLPNGWMIDSSGTQVEVGRLPQEALRYGNHIVVLNTGYYGTNGDYQISLVEPQTAQVVGVAHTSSLFPSAVVGRDDNLYVSGGIKQQVLRYTRRFDQPTLFRVTGYAAGLAAVDASHLAVVCLVE